MTNELFNTNPTDPVGVQSKYKDWTIDKLIEKAEHADRHISTLESEAAARRELEDTSETLEEILARLDTSRQPSFQQPTQPNNGVVTSNPSGTLSKEEVAAMVASAIENNQKTTKAQANVDKVKSTLTSKWGQNYQSKLNERASELGVNQTFLSTMAENYPDAFVSLVLDKQSTTNPNAHMAPASTTYVSPDKQPMSKWKDFSKAMKDNPRLRDDTTFQRLLHSTAEAAGESFYN